MFSYLPVKRQAALRLAQIIGADQTTLETAYTGAWASALDGSEIPRSAFRDVAMMVEKEIATVIGNNPNHPARSMIYGRSANLASLADTPTTDNNGVEWVGVFDSVIDASTGKPMTLQPTQTVEDLSNSFFDDTTFLHYAQYGNQIQTVGRTYYYQGCVWSYATQSAAWDADGNSPLPQVCANMLVNGICANSAQVGWVDNAGLIAQDVTLYQQGLQLLSTGLPNIPLASQVATN